MNIGIIGSGNMGSNLGRLFAQKGHHVVFSFSRDASALEQAAVQAGPNARADTPAQAAQSADVVLLAVGWQAVDAALQACGSLDGKTVISCVNPLSPDYTELVVGTSTSGAEQIAAKIPGAHVVEAFLNIFAGVLASDDMQFGADVPSVFYCGDDAQAKSRVKDLITDIGLEPIDSGPLKNARYVEPMAMLVLQLGAFLGMGREWRPGEFTDLSIKLLRR